MFFFFLLENKLVWSVLLWKNIVVVVLCMFFVFLFQSRIPEGKWPVNKQNIPLMVISYKRSQLHIDKGSWKLFLCRGLTDNVLTVWLSDTVPANLQVCVFSDSSAFYQTSQEAVNVRRLFPSAPCPSSSWLPATCSVAEMSRVKTCVFAVKI